MAKPMPDGSPPVPLLILPRFGTPRDLSRVTLGHEVGEVARRLRKPLMPWQQHAVDVALEVDPDTGELFYEEVVISVPRQSGKTTLLIALMVWRCLHMCRRLGTPQTVTYLAQTRNAGRLKLEREIIPLVRRATGLREVPHSRARPERDTDWKPSLNNGSEHILFGTGSFLQVAAPTETGSHGDVLDMPVIDEAFAHQNDLVEQAVDAATITRTSAQTYIISTAGNARSVFFWRKVLAGRRTVTEGRPSRSCYLEWSLPDDADYHDPEQWAQYLPALGHSIKAAKLATRLDKALANPDEVDDEGYEPGLPGFLRGYMNRWVDPPQLTHEVRPSEIAPEVWMSSTLVDAGSQIVGPCVIGVGVGLNGLSASFVVAGRNAAGRVHVETLVRDAELWRFEARLRGFVQTWQPSSVAWYNNGPSRAFAPEIQRATALCTTSSPVPLNGLEWRAACAAFVRAVADAQIVHLGDLLLEDSVRGAFRREVGDGWEWDLAGARTDITALLAATAAVRAVETLAEPVKSKWFMY